MSNRNRNFDNHLAAEQRQKLITDLNKTVTTPPDILARQLDLVHSLMNQERELIDGVEDLLATARFLTLEPLAAYTRLRGTEPYIAFIESYRRVESWFDLQVKTRERLAQDD
jgi:hypothetical protein